jgi:ribosomal protein S27AE
VTPLDLTSIYPADVAKRAAIQWRRTNLVTCPRCNGYVLAGWLDGVPLAYVCQRCGVVEN